MIVGYCICSECGYTDNKFNWHTYFICPVCGCNKYNKPNLWGEFSEGNVSGEGNISKEEGGVDRSMLDVNDDNW